MQCRAARPTWSASALVRPLSSRMRWNSCGPSPGVTPVHSDVYGFIRSPVEDRGSSCRNTSRSAKVGSSFSMPMTVMRVSGRVRHIRPLPSDSTTQRVPVSAMPKFAPDTATRGGEELAAQVVAGGHREPARLVGEIRWSTSAISARKMSRISVRFRWIAGTRMCEGLSWASCTMSSARSVSTAAMPCSSRCSLSPISWVAMDLTFSTSSAPVARIRSVTIRLASAASTAQCTDPAAGGDVRLELLEQLRQPRHHVGLDRGPGVPQRLPVGHLAHHLRAFGPDGGGGVREVRAQLRVAPVRGGRPSGTARLRAAATVRPNRRSPRPACGAAARRGTCSCRVLPASTPGSARGARCARGDPARDRPPPMCIRQDESPAVQTCAPVTSTLRHLVRQHRRDRVGVLQREGAAEPAALLGLAAARPDRCPATARSSRQRLVAHPQHPQRMARRVIGDPVRVVRADIRHPEHVDQQLGQLVGARRRPPSPARRARGPRRVAPPSRADAGSTRRTTRTAPPPRRSPPR